MARITSNKPTSDQHPSDPQASEPQTSEPQLDILASLNSKSADYAVKVTDRLLQIAMENRASDLHFDSTANGMLIRMRAQGILSELAVVEGDKSSQIVARVKSLSGLLSYRSDVPQEGRMPLAPGRADARVCTLPTLHGERLVVRFSIAPTRQWDLTDLGLTQELYSQICKSIESASGVVLVCGPAGSGKTTTAYAMMHRLAQASESTRRCLVSLEDPIEQAIDGVAQSQIQPTVGYTWTTGLKAMLRQDPEVMLIGEIRDAETARVVFQAASTGQLVISTMHARSVGDAVARLIDMEVPKHQILSAMSLLIALRLVRSNVGTDRDRILLVEKLPAIQTELREAILSESSAMRIQDTAVQQGMQTLKEQAAVLTQCGAMDEPTFRRHFDLNREEP